MKGYLNTINVIQEWAPDSQEFEERRNAFLNEKGEVPNHVPLCLSSAALPALVGKALCPGDTH